MELSEDDVLRMLNDGQTPPLRGPASKPDKPRREHPSRVVIAGQSGPVLTTFAAESLTFQAAFRIVVRLVGALALLSAILAVCGAVGAGAARLAGLEPLSVSGLVVELIVSVALCSTIVRLMLRT